MGGQNESTLKRKTLSNSVTGGYDDVMCHRYKRKQVHHCNRHTQGISSCRRERYCSHSTRGNNCQTHCEIGANNLQRIYMAYQESKTNVVCTTQKLLYGTLQASLLLWKLLSDMIGWGFTINPYDQCIANKTINGRQCNIIWHVDDLKISHVE